MGHYFLDIQYIVQIYKYKLCEHEIFYLVLRKTKRLKVDNSDLFFCYISKDSVIGYYIQAIFILISQILSNVKNSFVFLLFRYFFITLCCQKSNYYNFILKKSNEFSPTKKKREQIIINGFYNYLVFNGLCVPKKKLYFGPNKSKTQDLSRHILSTIPGGG